MKHHFSQTHIAELRALPLPAILLKLGARRDQADRRKWQTAQGTLSISGSQYYNWHTETGGGGAIDLVMHLQQSHCKEAMHWLAAQFPPHPSHSESDGAAEEATAGLTMPSPNPAQLWRIKAYLTDKRFLLLTTIEKHIHAGTLYADTRANAVFVLRTPEGEIAGAELRGTGSIPWRGMARGTRKNHGYFSTALTPNEQGKRHPIILCESAIDALSCQELHPGYRCLSTAGARANPTWLSALLDTGTPIYCGYDTDRVGQQAARAMMAFHPTVERLRPESHDWNDDLRLFKKTTWKKRG